MGPRDLKPTSTMIVRSLAQRRIVVLPPGGIPIVDARVLATAHRRALEAGGGGTRYAVVGPYLSYPELAAVVASIAGRPRRVIALSDRWEPALGRVAEWTSPLFRRWIPDLSRQLIAGGFLRLHVDGRRADACFGLEASARRRVDRGEPDGVRPRHRGRDREPLPRPTSPGPRSSRAACRSFALASSKAGSSALRVSR